MPTSHHTLWSLLKHYQIQIPIIQRDYAQGRADEHATAIRKKFLHALHDALHRLEPLDLDFVYGHIVKDTGTLIPLDGQQRLTTLFLLHWYLACAAGMLPEARPRLCKFTYETRSSSRDFCAELVKYALSPTLHGPLGRLSAELRDAAWFQPAWERDPTVKAMLTMLDAIDGMFGLDASLFTRLMDETAPPIGFQFLQLERVGLTDDLYLKMNARGKTLTDFENWKAEFDQFLHQTHRMYRREFAEKIDGKWADFFWHYRTEPTTKFDAPRIDEALKRYLDFVTRMLGLQRSSANAAKLPTPTSVETIDPFAPYRDVYEGCPKNIEFLFRSLDLLHAANDMKALFGAIFSNVHYEPGKVRLFEGDTNLFQRCIEDRLDIRGQVLLFAVLRYAVTVGHLVGGDPNLSDLVRVVRNLLERVRQQNNTEFNSNLRERDLVDYIADVDALVRMDGTNLVNVYDILATDEALTLKGFSQRSVKYEAEKACLLLQNQNDKSTVQALEDFGLFRGSLHNLAPLQNQPRLGKFSTAVREIWDSDMPLSLIIRALLTVGDYSIWTQGTTVLGPKFFLGNAYIFRNTWHTVLTNEDVKMKALLPQFLDTYLAQDAITPKQKLEGMVTKWLATNDRYNWLYYFINYPEMTDGSQGYFVRTSDFRIRVLTGSSLKGAHINAYVRAVCRLVGDSGICNLDDQYVNNSFESPLWYMPLPGVSPDLRRTSLSSENDGWHIKLTDGYTLSPDLIARYRCEIGKNGTLILRESDTQDRLQVAVAFSRELFQAESVLATDLADSSRSEVSGP